LLIKQLRRKANKYPPNKKASHLAKQALNKLLAEIISK